MAMSGNHAAGAGKRFVVSVANGQIMLKVMPRGAAEDPVTADEIASECTRLGYKGFDEIAILSAIDSAPGEAVAIGVVSTKASSAVVELSGRVSVRVSSDGMQATVRLVTPAKNAPPQTEEEIRSVLRAEGVTYGLLESVVRGLGASPYFEEEILVAEGKPVVHGQDGRVDYHFDVEKEFRPLIADETGRVDHKELNLIENVVQGQLLAARKPPIPGTPGITVRNEYIPPDAGKEADLEAGKFVVLSEDGNEARAEEQGMAMLHAGKVTVSKIYRVAGSVGPSTGNISFLGTVEIADSIEDGYEVKASEDIIIGKTLGKSVIEAGNNITLLGGVMGHNEGKITAGGNLNAKFIQEAIVDVRGDVIVTEAILHSEVEAGRRIIVGLGGKKGMIVGGMVRALTMIACRTLGSPMTTKTQCDVGRNPKLLKRFEELQASVIADRKNFENIKKGLTALSAIKLRTGVLPPEKEQILSTLQIAQESLKAKLQETASELRYLQNQLRVKIKGVISIAEALHPGVKIMIGATPYYVTQVEKFITLKEEEGEIRATTYQEPHVEKEKKKKKSDE